MMLSDALVCLRDQSLDHDAALLTILQTQCTARSDATSALVAICEFLQEGSGLKRSNTATAYALGALVGLSQDLLSSEVGGDNDEESTDLLSSVAALAVRFLHDDPNVLSNDGSHDRHGGGGAVVNLQSPAAALLCFLSSASDATAVLVSDSSLPILVRSTHLLAASLEESNGGSGGGDGSGDSGGGGGLSTTLAASAAMEKLQCLQYLSLCLWYQTRVAGRAATLLSHGALQALRKSARAAAAVANAVAAASASAASAAADTSRSQSNVEDGGADCGDEGNGDQLDDTDPHEFEATLASCTGVIGAACSASLHLLKPLLHLLSQSGGSGEEGSESHGTRVGWGAAAGEAVSVAATCIHSLVLQHALRFNKHPTTTVMSPASASTSSSPTIDPTVPPPPPPSLPPRAPSTAGTVRGGRESSIISSDAAVMIMVKKKKEVEALTLLRQSLELPLTLLNTASSTAASSTAASSPPSISSSLSSSSSPSSPVPLGYGGGGLRREELSVDTSSAALDVLLSLLDVLGGQGGEVGNSGSASSDGLSSFLSWACEELVPSLVSSLFRGAAVELDMRRKLLLRLRQQTSDESGASDGGGDEASKTSSSPSSSPLVVVVAARPSTVPNSGSGLFAVLEESPSPSSPSSASTETSTPRSASADPLFLDPPSLPAGSFVTVYPGEWRVGCEATASWWQGLPSTSPAATYTTTFASGAMQDGSPQAVARAAAAIRGKGTATATIADKGAAAVEGDDLSQYLRESHSLGNLANHPPKGTLPNLVFYEVHSGWLDVQIPCLTPCPTPTDDDDDGVEGGHALSNKCTPPNNGASNTSNNSLLDTLPVAVVPQEVKVDSSRVFQPDRVMVLVTLRRCFANEELFVNYGAAATATASPTAGSDSRLKTATGVQETPSSPGGGGGGGGGAGGDSQLLEKPPPGISPALPVWYHTPWSDSRVDLPPWKIQGPPPPTQGFS